MAEAMILNSKLRLLFETGVNEKGEPIVKSKTYSNIRKDATADQLLQTSTALASLCNSPLMSIEKNDSFEITN